MRYSKERREAVIKKMLPPNNRSIQQLSDEEGICVATLYKWRNDARAKGILLPNGVATPEGWSSADKFAAVVETAALNDIELGKYCREKGIYVEQVRQWREACEIANDWDKESSKRLKDSIREEKKKTKELERELRRKEKALAETAALLVLKKKPGSCGGIQRKNDQPIRSPGHSDIDQCCQEGRMPLEVCLRTNADRHEDLSALG